VCVHNLADEPREAKLDLGGGTLPDLVEVEEIGPAATGLTTSSSSRPGTTGSASAQ
jgi:hypothetical protein